MRILLVIAMAFGALQTAHSPLLTAEGRGVQIYGCSAQRSWVFQAPEATLYQVGVEVGKHSAGPKWMWKDGSAVTGKLIATKPAPDAAKDIPWLTLAATAVPGTTGALTPVARVLRTDTRGGVAPAGGCEAGATARVPYTATYTFWGE